MNAYQAAKPIMIFCLAVVLIGCGGEDLKRVLNDPPKEIFDFKILTGLKPETPVRIECRTLPCEISVTAYPNDQAPSDNGVTLDYARTGWGGDEEEAAREAQQNILVNMQLTAAGVEINVDSGPDGYNPRDAVILHARVPQHTPLVIRNDKGDIRVAGNLDFIDCETESGNIETRGAIGPEVLKTKHGDINVDELNNHLNKPRPFSNQASTNDFTLNLISDGGNISLYAVGVTVNASTKKGNIRFIGSLEGQKNVFKTTEKGNVIIVLPDTNTYTFHAKGGAQISTEFQGETLICGELPQDTPLKLESKVVTSTLGHVTIGPALFPTRDNVAIDMMPNNYYFIQTNRDRISKVAPEAATRKQQLGALWTQECEQQVKKDVRGQAQFNVETGSSGSIFVRLTHQN